MKAGNRFKNGLQFVAGLLFLAVKKLVVYSVCAVLLLLVIYGAAVIKDSKGSDRHWMLEDGTKIHFSIRSHDPPGRDTIKELDVTFSDGTQKTYQFAAWHAGYTSVKLRFHRAENIVWLVYRTGLTSDIGPSLNLNTRTFINEGGKHPEAVSLRGGKRIFQTDWW